jgi:hypothetical protein
MRPTRRRCSQIENDGSPLQIQPQRLDEEQQHVPENFRRDRHHSMRREQRPEKMSIAEASMIRNCASTPVGGPRSIPIDVTWGPRTPPPMAIDFLGPFDLSACRGPVQ